MNVSCRLDALAGCTRGTDVDGAAVDVDVAGIFLIGVDLQAIAHDARYLHGAAVLLEVLVDIDAVACCVGHDKTAGERLLELDVFVGPEGMTGHAVKRQCA